MTVWLRSRGAVMMRCMRDADPTLLTRVRAAVRGERDAAPLAAMRLASSAVYEELVFAERQIDTLLDAAGDAWRPGVAAASHQLATWVGFVLQTAGEHLIDTGGGYLPRPTFTLGWQCLTAAQHWLVRARQARTVEGYDLRRECPLPVRLPPWFGSTRHAPAHVPALLDAGQAIRLRAEYGVFALEKAESPRRLDWLRRLLAASAATHDYVERLRGAAANPMLLRYAMGHLAWSLNSWLLVGQLVAFPSFVDRYLPPPPKQRGTARVRYSAAVLDGRPRVLDGRPLVPAGRPPAPPVDLDDVVRQLPDLPFDVRQPPLLAPAGCADPTMWRRAYALLSEHSGGSARFCRCGRAPSCQYRLLATMSLVTAFLCGPGEPWPEPVRVLHRRIVTG